MRLKLIRHLWGVTESWETAFATFKAQGYEGIEAALPSPDQAARFRELLDRHGLAYIAQVYTDGNDVAGQVQSLRRLVEAAAKHRPLLINCHSGRDAFSTDQAIAFYGESLKIEHDAGLPIAHETHRARTFFNPWSTRAVLEALPDVKLCCDFSHWVCVCQRLLDDCLPILRLCASRCIHLHARVGYAHGPQVPDPSAPEYARELEAHERWWDQIWDAQRDRGMAESTLTPEFGPPGYLHTLPHTHVPVADLASVCLWMARRQSERFRARSSG